MLVEVFHVLAVVSCPILQFNDPYIHKNSSDVYVGVTVGFSCDFGYAVNGAESISCLESGRWDNSFPTCTEVVCESLSWSDPHLLMGNAGTALGNRVTFSCTEGWVLNGSSSSVCQTDGWSDSVPSCMWEGFCPELLWSDPRLSAGNSLGNRTVGNFLTFSCVEGWHLNGSRFTTCQPNGTWTNPQPHCILNICGTFSFDTSHGNFTVDNTTSVYTNGTRVTIQCDEGYAPLYGGTVVTCVGGRWLPARPQCKLMCDPLTLGPGVRANTSETFPGILVEFSCEDNLILEGNYITRCSFEIGLWVSHPPSCNQAICPPLNLSEGLMPSSNNQSVGTVVTFHCEEGWHVSNDIATVCFPNGSWSAPIPTCIEGGDIPTTDIPGNSSGLTGAQVGGLIGGVIVGMLLVIFITAVVTAISTRKLCSKRMDYASLSQDISLQED